MVTIISRGDKFKLDGRSVGSTRKIVSPQGKPEGLSTKGVNMWRAE